VKLTVLGSSAAYPRPGGACSGYLVEQGSTRLLVDCGTGVLSNLQQVTALKEITHIVISHFHGDHILDIIPYRYALFHQRQEAPRPRLYLPPGGGEALLNSVSVFDTPRTFFYDFFEMEEYDPGSALKADDLSIEFAAAKHYISAYAMAISGGGKRLVYSSDSGPCGELAALAKGADLFLCEATRCENDEEWGHMTAVEAATLAREAGVKRLVLTHFWPDCDYSRLLEQAGAAFGRAFEMAQEFSSYTIE